MVTGWNKVCKERPDRNLKIDKISPNCLHNTLVHVSPISLFKSLKILESCGRRILTPLRQLTCSILTRLLSTCHGATHSQLTNPLQMGLEDEDEVVKNGLHNKHISTTDRPYDEWRGKPLLPAACTKVSHILAACKQGCVDDHLGILATSADGLVDDEVRRVACTFKVNLWGAQRSSRVQGHYCWDMR